MNMYQQGDCLLKIKKINFSGMKEVQTDLLFKGEQHHHRLRGDFHQFDNADGNRFIKVIGPTELFHEEHKSINLPAGDYALEFVQEYDHWLEESRQVID
jgi:hypothetical protein